MNPVSLARTDPPNERLGLSAEELADRGPTRYQPVPPRALEPKGVVRAAWAAKRVTLWSNDPQAAVPDLSTVVSPAPPSG